MSAVSEFSFFKNFSILGEGFNKDLENIQTILQPNAPSSFLMFNQMTNASSPGTTIISSGPFSQFINTPQAGLYEFTLSFAYILFHDPTLGQSIIRLIIALGTQFGSIYITGGGSPRLSNDLEILHTDPPLMVSQNVSAAGMFTLSGVIDLPASSVSSFIATLDINPLVGSASFRFNYFNLTVKRLA
jgi:hypothetical protein